MVREIIAGGIHLSELDSLEVLGLVRRLLGDVAVHIELFYFGRFGSLYLVVVGVSTSVELVISTSVVLAIST